MELDWAQPWRADALPGARFLLFYSLACHLNGCRPAIIARVRHRMTRCHV